MKIVFLFFLSVCLPLCGIDLKKEKVLICGVCRNVENAVAYNIKNIEALGKNFADYAVIIYENNSTDDTVFLFSKWAKKNPKVIFRSENIPVALQPVARTEKIAAARNKVLSIAKDSKFYDFAFLIMVDLDFRTPWPIEEILNTIKSPPQEWDAVFSNGYYRGYGTYHDRYAFRDLRFPLGPELLAELFWQGLKKDDVFTYTTDEWQPVFSSFGGLAIYKTARILPYYYSGIVTEDLKNYYKSIFASLPKDHPKIKQYLALNGIVPPLFCDIPVIFRYHTCEEHDGTRLTCCEHVPLHASMAMNGYGKFFVNPKLKMVYLTDGEK